MGTTTRIVSIDDINGCVRISRALDLMYLCNYKSACTTILLSLALRDYRRQLLTSLPDEHSVHTDDVFVVDEFDIVNNRMFTFSFVRNPYVRILSAYLDKIQRPSSKYRIEFCGIHGLDGERDITFCDFLSLIKEVPPSERDAHWRPQADNLLLGGLDIDFVGHLEFFWSDFETLSGKTELRIDPDINRSGQAHATNAGLTLGHYYSKRETELVNAMFEEDFLAFRYRFDPTNRNPTDRRLEFKAYDKATHHFIRGVGLRRTSPSLALVELRKAMRISNSNPSVNAIIESLSTPDV